jgi:hypothetical protein
MSLLILNEIELDPSLKGLEKDLIEEFNFIVHILSDKNVNFTSATAYLMIKDFNYFSVLSINNKIYVRQLKFNKEITERNILKKYYK